MNTSDVLSRVWAGKSRQALYGLDKAPEVERWSRYYGGTQRTCSGAAEFKQNSRFSSSGTQDVSVAAAGPAAPSNPFVRSHCTQESSQDAVLFSYYAMAIKPRSLRSLPVISTSAALKASFQRQPCRRPLPLGEA